MKRFYVKNNAWIPRIAEIIRANKVVGLDIETCPREGWAHDSQAGLDPYKSRIRLIQIATPEYSWIIDLNHVTDITPILDLFSTDIVWIIHNAIFETKNFLHHYDVFPDKVFDTFLASRLFQRVYDYSVRHGLGYVVQRYLNEEMNKDEQLSDWSLAELSESQIEYAYRDVEVLLPLYDVLIARLHEEGMMRSAISEFDSVLTYADMELTGLVLDMDVLNQIRSIMEERLSKLRKYFATELPARQYGLFEQEPVNLNSPSQLIDAFERRTGVRLSKTVRVEGGKWNDWVEKESADKTALLQNRKVHQVLVDALLDYGSLVHMLDNYCTVDEHIHPVTGRIHPEYKPLGQWQHRAATGHPALNFPRPDSFGPGVTTPALINNFYAPVSFRNLFKAPEGELYSIVDFAGNQLRILSDEFFANETTLIAEFNHIPHKDANPYKRIASRGLGKAFEDVTKQERFAYKTLTLALMFICGVKRFMQTRLEETRLPMTKEQAEKEINSFFMAVPAIGKWHSRVLPELQERKYVETPWGRKIYFPDMYMTPNRAANFPICASEKDGASLAGGKISRELRKQNRKARPVMFVYDEYVLSGPQGEMKEVLALQEKIMQESMQQVLSAIPAVVEGAIATSWGGKK